MPQSSYPLIARLNPLFGADAQQMASAFAFGEGLVYSSSSLICSEGWLPALFNSKHYKASILLLPFNLKDYHKFHFFSFDASHLTF